VYVAVTTAAEEHVSLHSRDEDKCGCEEIHTREDKQHEEVASGTVVLVQGLSVLHASDQVREVELHNSNRCIQKEEDVRDEAENGMGRLEVSACDISFVSNNS
jgi:hypothetical protein